MHVAATDPPPRDGTWINVTLMGKTTSALAQFDSKWGKSGGWFTSEGHAFKETDIHVWELPSSFMQTMLKKYNERGQS